MSKLSELKTYNSYIHQSGLGSRLGIYDALHIAFAHLLLFNGFFKGRIEKRGLLVRELVSNNLIRLLIFLGP